jgi:hypothetical protein
MLQRIERKDRTMKGKRRNTRNVGFDAVQKGNGE